MLCECSAYVLKLEDAINHLFGEPMFARFAGTRSLSMMDSPLYERLDRAHGGALTALSSSHDSVTVDAATSNVREDVDEVGGPSHHTQLPAHSDVAEDDNVTPDPTDEIMTGDNDTIALFFALFVDGVQLHDHGRATTTVVGLKCLDLPGFMCNSDLSCFPLAYIGGKKEPTNLSQFMTLLLQQFKDHEAFGCRDEQGENRD